MTEMRRFLEDHPEWSCDSHPLGGVDLDPWITLDFTLKSDYRRRERALRGIGDFALALEGRLENMRVRRLPKSPATIRYRFRIADYSQFRPVRGTQHRRRTRNA